MFGRKQVAILAAEFLGTGFLALIMLSVAHSGIGQLPYFTALGAGLALATLIVVFAGNGGGHFNPAITIGMWTVQQIKFLPMLTYLAAQFLGGLAAFLMHSYFLKTTLPASAAQFDLHIFFAELIGALLLSLAFAAAVFNQYLTTKRAATVGAAYALSLIVAMGTMGSIGMANPAVALSFRAFDPLGTGASWATYVAAPILGAFLGFTVYAFLFAPESSLARVGSAVSGRFGRSAKTSRNAVAAPAPTRTSSSRTSKTAAKPAAKRSTRSTRTRKTTRTRK